VYGSNLNPQWLSPWFKATQHKPVRVGRYQYTGWCITHPLIFWWDGENWFSDPNGGCNGFCVEPMMGDMWRGLAQPHDDGGER
jgi:hypothetical protein